MKTKQKKHKNEISESQQRLLEAFHLHEIEGNPLTQEEKEMFEMFDREGWSDEECREYIIKTFKEKYLILSDSTK